MPRRSPSQISRIQRRGKVRRSPDSKPQPAAAGRLPRVRADSLLVGRELAPSRQKAQALIMAGLVWSGGRRVEKPGELLRPDQELGLQETLRYVSRGGLKLEQALDAFAVKVEGRVAADLGVSTGGFSDCLLQRGARRVYAVDVDVRQLDARLRSDPRIISLQRNARSLSADDFSERLDLVTADLSFISVLKVLPAVRTFLGSGQLLCLLKPQFEAGRRQVGKRGIVRDPAVHAEVLRNVVLAAAALGFMLQGLIKCSTRGQKGNQEFFAHWRLGRETRGPAELERLVQEVVEHGQD